MEKKKLRRKTGSKTRKSRSVRRKSIRKSRRKSRRKSKPRKPTKSKSKSRKLKLSKIVKSPNKTKKYRAYFNDDTHTDFGAKGYQNYGGVGKERHLDEERKKRYIERHKRNENWKNPKSAGSLSRYVLWNKKTLKASIADYKKRFKL